MPGVVPSLMVCGCTRISGHLYQPCAEHAPGKSLWDLQKEWNGIDPATPLPTSLDARRRTDDALTHCPTCGGIAFTGTIVFTDTGQPVRVLTPQKCVGCGELRRANWP